MYTRCQWCKKTKFFISIKLLEDRFLADLCISCTVLLSVAGKKVVHIA